MERLRNFSLCHSLCARVRRIQRNRQHGHRNDEHGCHCADHSHVSTFGRDAPNAVPDSDRYGRKQGVEQTTIQMLDMEQPPGKGSREYCNPKCK